MAFTDIGNSLRAMSSKEIVEWVFSEISDLHSATESKQQIYDLLGFLNELGHTCLLPAPLRGMLIFKLSSILGGNEVGTRFHEKQGAKDTPKPASVVDDEMRSLLLWANAHNDTHQAYELSTRNLPRLHAFLDRLSLYLADGVNSAEDALEAHEPFRKKRRMGQDQSEGEIPESPKLPRNFWWEALCVLSMRVRGELTDPRKDESVQKDENKMSPEDAHALLEKIDALSNKLTAEDSTFRLAYTPDAQSDAQDLLRSGRKSTDDGIVRCHTDSEVSLQKNEEEQAPVQEWKLSNDRVGLENVALLSECSYEAIYSKDLADYARLAVDDMDFAEPELWRTRSHLGVFQSYRKILHHARMHTSGMKTLVQVLQDSKADASAPPLHETMLKAVHKANDV